MSALAMTVSFTATALGADDRLVSMRMAQSFPAAGSGWVTGMRCQKMELGEPDASGRRRPVAVEGSDFLIDVDTVIYALGTTANPIIAQTTPGLSTNKWGYITIDENSGMTNIPGLFAGGDIVTGAATVILAMGAGKRAASGMLEYMGLAAAEAAELSPVGGN